MNHYEIHPAADAFPMMDESRYAELVDSLRTNGQRLPIVLHNGKILDGRNRYKGCCELEIEPRFTEHDGDPWQYVWDLNGQRRDLVAEQRYLIWKHLNEQSEAWQAEQQRIRDQANRKRSEAAKGNKNAAPTETVREHNVHVPSAQPERKAKAAAAKANAGAVARGDKLARERPDLAEKVRVGEMKPAEAHREMKRTEQRKRLAELTARNSQSAQGQYHVIVIDPPWPMHKIERDCRPNQAEMDYPTMTESELAGLHIPAFQECHLWLWTTHKFLPMALRLLGAWDFKYVCTFVWHKPGGFQPVGLPQYNCEFALYARRGSPMFLDTKGFPTCFTAPRGKHSEKPDAFYDLVRRVTGGPRLDMFNRRAIEGFDGWGNEAE